MSFRYSSEAATATDSAEESRKFIGLIYFKSPTCLLSFPSPTAKDLKGFEQQTFTTTFKLLFNLSDVDTSLKRLRQRIELFIVQAHGFQILQGSA